MEGSKGKIKANLSIFNLNLTAGGAEKVISLLLKCLVNDYNVTLILIYNSIHFKIPEGVNLVVLNDYSEARPFYKRILDSITVVFKYNRALKQNRIKYAVAFLPFPSLVNGIISILNPKLKTIISERGFPSDNTTSKLSLLIARIGYPLLYNRCKKLFSNSVYINADLKTNFGVRIPMEVIYNPIELPERTKVPSALGVSLDTMKVINVGSLNDRKNQKIIIEALSMLNPDYCLTILGSGENMGELEDKIQELGLQNKVFLKGKQKDVNSFLIENDCFVLSSNTEGFPNVVLEAMAVGLPVISTNCLSGPHELLHDNEPLNIAEGQFFKAKYGILVRTNDVKGIASALKYLKDNPSERERYATLSLKRAKKFELKTIYAQFNQFIIN